MDSSVIPRNAGGIRTHQPRLRPGHYRSDPAIRAPEGLVAPALHENSPTARVPLSSELPAIRILDESELSYMKKGPHRGIKTAPWPLRRGQQWNQFPREVGLTAAPRPTARVLQEKQYQPLGSTRLVHRRPTSRQQPPPGGMHCRRPVPVDHYFAERLPIYLRRSGTRQRHHLLADHFVLKYSQELGTPDTDLHGRR